VISYIIRKFLYSILILWGVVTLIFMVFTFLPGDPAIMKLGQGSDSASLAIVRKDFGLNQSKGMRYLKSLNDLSPVSFHETRDRENYFFLDSSVYSSFVTLMHFGEHRAVVLKPPYLRRSYQSKKDVSAIIGETIPNTLILAFASIVFASLLGIVLGIFSAIYKESWYDRITLFLSSFGMSLPSFFAAILFGWLFAYVLADITHLNLTGNLIIVDDFGEGYQYQWKNLILPAFTLGIRPLGVFVQLTRNSMLEVLSMDYIRTARAKGLSEFKVVVRHALKNALNPVITAISGWFASMMAGVVFVEYIFAWKGLGYVIVDALTNYDLPLVMGCVLVISLVFIAVNLLVDILYGILDPRVKVY
jgi:peptide/nickel transport system permease protein